MATIGSIIGGAIAGLMVAGVFVSIFRDEWMQERDAMMRRIHEAEGIIGEINKKVDAVSKTVDSDYVEFSLERRNWNERWKWIKRYLNHCLRKLKAEECVWEESEYEAEVDKEKGEQIKETVKNFMKDFKYEEPEDDPDNPRS